MIRRRFLQLLGIGTAAVVSPLSFPTKAGAAERVTEKTDWLLDRDLQVTSFEYRGYYCQWHFKDRFWGAFPSHWNGLIDFPSGLYGNDAKSLMATIDAKAAGLTTAIENQNAALYEELQGPVVPPMKPVEGQILYRPPFRFGDRPTRQQSWDGGGSYKPGDSFEISPRPAATRAARDWRSYWRHRYFDKHGRFPEIR